MINTPPTFPPLLNGHRLASDENPFKWAIEKTKSGQLSAGDIVWSEVTNQLNFALVMEPDVPRERCHEILFVAMVALGDAVGALVPPEVSVKYQWPNQILMNDGAIGIADLMISKESENEIPDWMVLSISLQIMPDFVDDNPGEKLNVTTMWDEGCGEITRTELLESVSRHTVAMIHTWSEDGFKPIHKLWMGRLMDQNKIPDALGHEKMIGLDEAGNALVSQVGTTVSISIEDALSQLRQLDIAAT